MSRASGEPAAPIPRDRGEPAAPIPRDRGERAGAIPCAGGDRAGQSAEARGERAARSTGTRAERGAAGTARPPRIGAGGRALLLALAGVPLLLIVVAATEAWRGSWREARFELTRTADASAEYALRVLSGYAVAAGRVDAILRGLSDAEIHAHERELHDEMRRLVGELPQAEAAYVVDREGRALVGASIFPVPRGQATAADRDFFSALSAADPPAAHVSQVYRSRFDDRLFFAVSRRRTRTGNADSGPNGFDGLVNVSVYPDRIAEGLSRLSAEPGDTLTLVRADGELLARSTGQSAPAQVPISQAFRRLVAEGVERTLYEAVSTVDGTHRLYAVRRVEGWPVYILAGRSRDAIIAGWRRTVARQLLIGLPASAVLLGLALMVLRAQARLAAANAGLEQRVAERTAALAASEARLSDALQVGRVFAFAWDAASDRVQRSPSAAAVLGLPATLAEHDRGRRFMGRLEPEDAERLLAVQRSLAPAAPTYALRVRYRRDDGSLVWLHMRGAAGFAADGTLARITGLSRDVTAEAAAELALRSGEARMRELLATLDLGAAMVRDPDGTIRFWSRGCELLYGWSAAEALGQISHVLLGTVFPEPLAGIEATLAREGSWSGDLRHRTRDGRLVVVTARLALRRAGTQGPDSVLEMLADVTAHRAAEAALAEREAEFRAMFEGSIVGMVQADPATGQLIRVNRRFCEMTGYAEAELAGVALFDLLHPGDRHVERARIGAAMAESGRLDMETRCLGKDGAVIWVLLHVALVRGTGGAPARIVAVLQDITERRRAEEQRELMTRELDHRAKNALAVVQAALRLTPKTDAESYARAIEGRVAALARAHTLLAHGRWEGAMLRALLEAEMATFLLEDGRGGEAAGPPRVIAEGPDLLLLPAAVQAVSMALHELATNATKYGALSVPGGTVRIAWTEDRTAGLLRLSWTERDGPPVLVPPVQRGFGSRVIEATVRDQLGGEVTRRWDPEGLVCAFDLPLARVAGTRLALA